ncbi:MAG: hypothetical protein HY586_05900 [Candidatus Omnitrophica bacterium]|nr:hypothetical protein [Candidatus Omnitrophota bacterium]
MMRFLNNSQKQKKIFSAVLLAFFISSIFSPVSGFVRIAFAQPAAFSNVMNFGFEEAGAAATDPLNWTTFITGGALVSQRVIAAPGPVGVPFLTQGVASLYMNTAGGETSGAFQNIFGVTQGDTVSFEADARTPNLAGPAGDGWAEIKIEFFNQAGVEINEIASTAITTANTGAAFARFSVTGKAPSGTSYARLVLDTVLDGGLGAGDVVFDNLSCIVTKFGGAGVVRLYPVTMSSPVNNIEAWPGKLITFTMRINNNTAVAIPAAQVNLTIPFGLDIVRNSVQTGGLILRPDKVGPNVAIPIAGGLASGETRLLTFQVLVTGGVTVGQVYDVVSLMINPLTGAPISNTTVIPILIVGDAVFDQGTVIGKVFNDQNENTMQDEGEEGIPNVRLVLETGVVVYTDKDGKYHIPALRSNRHILKIDGHTLPAGTKFITEEKFLFKTTPGMLSKVSFAVKLPIGQVPEKYRKDLNVYLSQYYDASEPVLKIWMFPTDLKLGQGIFEVNPIFHLDTNYGAIIGDWRIEVRNEYGELVWTGYGEGEPPAEVPWSGIGDNEKPIEPGDYSYRLIVADKDNKEDWTALQYFRVVSKVTGAGQALEQPYTDTGFFGVMKEGKRSIPLTRQGMVMVRGHAAEGRQVMINNRKITPQSDGSFEEVIYLPYGKNNVVVSSTDVEGSTIHYAKDVEVKDKYFFLVGLAEGELGYNQIKGSYETLGESDQFRDAFYQEGRVAFYVKGKIKGSLLITAAMDTDNREPDRNLSKLFTNLDPDAYYPVYGDQSQINWDATDSQDRFYILVECDRSFFRYGSFNTDFKDSELTPYNRTLSGGMGHFETMSTTKYGDPKAGFTVFSANTRQAADHNEFFGTGGSVYYLRHRLVVEGSDKLRIEVRDKIQNIAIVSKDLVEGEDYEIDYQAGRVLMYRPVSSVTYTDTIINTQILNGNKLVLIADYEYETQSTFDWNTSGARGWTHAGDHVKVGGTYVRQTAQATASDYIVRGIDGTVRLGENTRITGEVAETSNSQSGTAISMDGGLSFDDNQTGAATRSEAYTLKGETKIGKRTDLSGYFTSFTPGYAVPDLSSQTGTRKYGIDARYRVTDHMQLRLRQDHLELVAPRTSVAPQVFFDPERQATTTLQALYARSKWDVTAEYRHQTVDVEAPFQVNTNTLNTGIFENAAGLKIGYQALDWFKPFVRGQVSMGGESNNQLGAGAEMRMPDGKTFGTLEQTVGNIGDATLIGIHRQVDEKTQVYSNLGVVNKRNGENSVMTAVGTSRDITEHQRIYTERRYTGNQAVDLNQQNLLGYDVQIADAWSLAATFERNYLDQIPNQKPTNQNAGSFTVAYNDQKRLKTAFKAELRYDVDNIKNRQPLFSQFTEYKLNDDITLKSRFNTSTTKNLTLEQQSTYFTELNVGVAYRPVKWDRFSFLTRYTFLDDKGLNEQYQGGTPLHQSSHTVALEGAYDLNRYFQLVQKLAVRHARFDLATGQDNAVDKYLWAPRLNFHVTRHWDVSGEWRILFQENAADDQLMGFVLEVDRVLAEYLRLTLGYDFSHFNDGITPQAGFEWNGFYVRLTGEF